MGHQISTKEEMRLHSHRDCQPSGLLTLTILNQVFLSFLEVNDGKAGYHSTILMNDFQGHGDKRVKEMTFLMKDVLN